VIRDPLKIQREEFQTVINYFHGAHGVIICLISAIINYSKNAPDSDPSRENEVSDSDTVRFLAWIKKRGAKVKCIYCRKKWGKHGPCAEDLVGKFGEDKNHDQRHPSTGDKWIVLDDLPWADTLMIEYGEEVPHHRQWMSWEK